MSKAKKVKAGLLAPRKRFVPKESDFLSTGSTLLNLALTGNPDWGFAKGKYYLLVGDSSSGKTFLTLTCLAEASINPSFDDYRFIHDDVEGGALMDFERFFGPKAAARIEPPEVDDDEVPVNSAHVEDFYFHLDDALHAEKPCIYVLDSMDGLSSQYEEKRFYERKKAKESNTQAKGDFGDGKPKVNSSVIRVAQKGLERTGSILLLISQTRDNVGGKMFEPKKTRSGGHALTFYATAEMWLSIRERIKKTVVGKSRTLGIVTSVRIKKNRTSGKERIVNVPIYYSTGIDDIGSCILYMIEEGFWQGTKGKVKAPEFDHDGSIDDLVEKIETANEERKLKDLVTASWNEIEAKCQVQRKSRYS